MSGKLVKRHPRRCQLLQVYYDWARQSPLYRQHPKVARWPPAEEDLREMMGVLSPLDQPDALPERVLDARRARRLCLRALDRGQLRRASNLYAYLVRLLADVARQEDIRDANAYRNVVQTARRNASKKRKRGPRPESKLRLRGLRRVLKDHRSITAERLIDILEAEGRLTYENENLELVLVDDDVIVRDLKERARVPRATIKVASLRKYLSDARNT